MTASRQIEPSKLSPLATLFLCVVAVGSLGNTAFAQNLYNGSLGTVPGSQGWAYAAIPSASQTLTNNSVQLDTTASVSTYAGYSQTANALDHTNGYTLLFTVQMLAETHNNTNRAGFSVIVLSSDKHGVELAFWTSTIFAQTDTPMMMFMHGEDVAFNTTGSFVHYALTMLATNYVLRANGTPILTGHIHDYTAFTGPINPYTTPNFIFLGDDTTSASASFQIQDVTLVTAPTLKKPAGGVISWTGVSNQTYTVQTSSNLNTWINTASVTSATTNFSYTNLPVTTARYLRIAYP